MLTLNKIKFITIVQNRDEQPAFLNESNIQDHLQMIKSFDALSFAEQQTMLQGHPACIVETTYHVHITCAIVEKLSERGIEYVYLDAALNDFLECSTNPKKMNYPSL